MEFEIDSYEHAGLTVKIGNEEYIEEHFSPRDSVDRLLGVMVTEYRNYTFGGGKNDESGYPDTSVECDRCDGHGELSDRWEVRDFMRALVSADFESEKDAEKFIDWSKRHSREHKPEDIEHWLVMPMDCPKCEGTGSLELSMLDWVRHQGARVCLPLFVYEHSGITMSAGGNMLTGEDNFSRKGRYAMDPGEWDTSSVGIYFDTTETREECGWEERSVEEIEKDLQLEITYYDAYLRGDVRYYVIEDEDGEVLDSCGGFLIATDDDERYMHVEAKHAAESAREAIEDEEREAAEWAARDVVTNG